MYTRYQMSGSWRRLYLVAYGKWYYTELVVRHKFKWDTLYWTVTHRIQGNHWLRRKRRKRRRWSKCCEKKVSYDKIWSIRLHGKRELVIPKGIYIYIYINPKPGKMLKHNIVGLVWEIDENKNKHAWLGEGGETEIFASRKEQGKAVQK